MAPSNPKRPPRPPRPPGAPSPKKQEVELPFDDDEVAPLQEDDPRPQRVPQFPAGPRRSARRAGAGRDARGDRELSTRFDANEYSDPGHSPAFLYVERGPGLGQLIPVKQGPLVIGRASACDLRLQHPSISRRHAQLMRQGERFVLRDLGSQNGTFVNRVKLTGDTDIRVGDEISLGNALMKLRGPGSSSDKVPLTALPVHKKPARMAMSLTRVALVAAAVGSAVAALLTLAFLKITSPESEGTASTDSASGAYVPPPSATEEERAASATEEESRAARPIVPPSSAKASGPRASSISAKSAASRKESGSRSSAQGTKSSAGEERADVISLYEKGDVATALSLARSAQLESLASRITDFQSAQEAGQKALNARDTASALRHLSAALAVDQELSQGWSVQGRKLRKQLGHLHTLTGVDQQKAGDTGAARESFKTALKYDPSNARAKKELQQLGGQP
ncbi:FHA domain-containing protein [Hyalangium rubrum]|uniref:FHA domain-containing protein n=1 Tax=Hyalangium rubrum TaxID=3103134 RepID=A0ABU5GVY8_9BACT|nr:FHA domain-containing protein [Hyalangium sp. s54d21]MDY7225251.1 FHA domain-containing protein [Hyalangium sp. s54d21]